MDYKKKYKEAFKRAKGMYEQGMMPERLEYVFPELKESEDERIRKEIIDIIDSYDVYHLKAAGLPSRIPEYIAWLEKQGEHANFRNKIQIGDKVTRNRDGVLVNLSQLNRVAKKDERQGENFPILSDSSNIGKDEQNPAWSEEDEDYYDAIIAKLEVTQEDAALTDNQMNFLKSLKGKIQPMQEWSEKDERYIQIAISDTLDKGHPITSNWLISLRDKALSKQG